MSIKKISDSLYGKEYFEGIYAHLKKEKTFVLESFYNLLIQKRGGIKSILDLGCGEGEFLSICQRKGLECFGVDVSDYALKKAKARVQGRLARVDLEKETLPFPGDYFEVVTIFDTVEHLQKPRLVFKEVRRVLKSDGLFFLTTPNGGYLPAGFFGHFVMNDPTHVNLQDAPYWQSQLREGGFEEIEIRGCLLFGFPPHLELRYQLRKLKLPVLTRPIFFPCLNLCSELFIFARKNEASLL